ncbi:MAG: alpha/beta hydrolase, partial [Caulobacteraceae bacterium]|nr:alpha/beta hydrolase [Caulobacteraceae bacterium]
ASAQLTERAGINPRRVALWGYSRGAGVAVNAATTPDSGVRSAILVAGGGSIGESPARTDLSVLLLHARRDEAVPVRATLELADALRAAGAEVQVQGLDFDGHQYDLPTWCAVMGRTRSFLETRTDD